MILPFLLAIGGFVMIYLEFFLPGSLMAIVGVIFIIASIFFLAYEGVGPMFLFFYIVLLIISLILCIKFALKRLKKTGKKGTFFLNSDQEGSQACEYNKELIGKTGVVTADLKPSGYVLIDNRYYQASSNSGYIEKGLKIEITGGQGACLMCKLIKEKE